MINDLNQTLAALLEQELKLAESGIKIVFAAPDTRFFQKVTPPLIDIFLYDIRENLTLRASEPFAHQKTGTDTTTFVRSPVPIDYSYLITAWGSSGPEGTPDKDQHDMLSQVLHALLRYPIWPADLLKGTLQAKHPLPKAYVAQPSHLHNMGEFWSAMGGHPRAVLHYTVTAPLYAHAPIENLPMVKAIVHQVDKINKAIQ